MGQIAKEMRRILATHGFERVRTGKGDQEIWRDPKTGRTVVVDDGTKSRHTANAALKRVGLPKAF